MQRFCLHLELRPDPQLIDEYVARHQRVWPEILQSIRGAGVVDMQIYREGTHLFMIMDTTDAFTFEAKAAMDRNNPIVMQWEQEMARYQAADPGSDASRKWRRMDAIFRL